MNILLTPVIVERVSATILLLHFVAGHRELTAYFRPHAGMRVHFQRSTDYLRPILHDPQSQSGVRAGSRVETAAVILHRQVAAAMLGNQPNHNTSRFAVFDGVVYGFLR